MLPFRLANYAGIAAFIIFWTALFAVASLDPTYSQKTKAVSELGVFGARNAFLWNLVGFIVPGILLSFVGTRIAISVEHRRAGLWWLLGASGLFFAASAIPAEMEGGSPLLDSPFTIAHLTMATLSLLLWLVAIIVLPFRIRNQRSWQKYFISTIVIGTFAFASCVPMVVPDLLPQLTRAVLQRFAFMGYFAWFLAMSIILIAIEYSRTTKIEVPTTTG